MSIKKWLTIMTSVIALGAGGVWAQGVSFTVPTVGGTTPVACATVGDATDWECGLSSAGVLTVTWTGDAAYTGRVTIRGSSSNIDNIFIKGEDGEITGDVYFSDAHFSHPSGGDAPSFYIGSDGVTGRIFIESGTYVSRATNGLLSVTGSLNTLTVGKIDGTGPEITADGGLTGEDGGSIADVGAIRLLGGSLETKKVPLAKGNASKLFMSGGSVISNDSVGILINSTVSYADGVIGDSIFGGEIIVKGRGMNATAGPLGPRGDGIIVLSFDGNSKLFVGDSILGSGPSITTHPSGGSAIVLGNGTGDGAGSAGWTNGVIIGGGTFDVTNGSIVTGLKNAYLWVGGGSFTIRNRAHSSTVAAPYSSDEMMWNFVGDYEGVGIGGHIAFEGGLINLEQGGIVSTDENACTLFVGGKTNITANVTTLASSYRHAAIDLRGDDSRVVLSGAAVLNMTGEGAIYKTGTGSVDIYGGHVTATNLDNAPAAVYGREEVNLYGGNITARAGAGSPATAVKSEIKIGIGGEDEQFEVREDRPTRPIPSLTVDVYAGPNYGVTMGNASWKGSYALEVGNLDQDGTNVTIDNIYNAVTIRAFGKAANGFGSVGIFAEKLVNNDKNGTNTVSVFGVGGAFVSSKTSYTTDTEKDVNYLDINGLARMDFSSDELPVISVPGGSVLMHGTSKVTLSNAPAVAPGGCYIYTARAAAGISVNGKHGNAELGSVAFFAEGANRAAAPKPKIFCNDPYDLLWNACHGDLTPEVNTTLRANGAVSVGCLKMSTGDMEAIVADSGNVTIVGSDIRSSMPNGYVIEAKMGSVNVASLDHMNNISKTDATKNRHLRKPVKIMATATGANANVGIVRARDSIGIYAFGNQPVDIEVANGTGTAIAADGDNLSVGFYNIVLRGSSGAAVSVNHKGTGIVVDNRSSGSAKLGMALIGAKLTGNSTTTDNPVVKSTGPVFVTNAGDVTSEIRLATRNSKGIAIISESDVVVSGGNITGRLKGIEAKGEIIVAGAWREPGEGLEATAKEYLEGSSSENTLVKNWRYFDAASKRPNSGEPGGFGEGGAFNHFVLCGAVAEDLGGAVAAGEWDDGTITLSNWRNHYGYLDSVGVYTPGFGVVGSAICVQSAVLVVGDSMGVHGRSDAGTGNNRITIANRDAKFVAGAEITNTTSQSGNDTLWAAIKVDYNTSPIPTENDKVKGGLLITAIDSAVARNSAAAVLIGASTGAIGNPFDEPPVAASPCSISTPFGGSIVSYNGTAIFTRSPLVLKDVSVRTAAVRTAGLSQGTSTRLSSPVAVEAFETDLTILGNADIATGALSTQSTYVSAVRVRNSGKLTVGDGKDAPQIRSTLGHAVVITGKGGTAKTPTKFLDIKSGILSNAVSTGNNDTAAVVWLRNQDGAANNIATMSDGWIISNVFAGRGIYSEGNVEILMNGGKISVLGKGSPTSIPVGILTRPAGINTIDNAGNVTIAASDEGGKTTFDAVVEVSHGIGIETNGGGNGNGGKVRVTATQTSDDNYVTAVVRADTGTGILAKASGTPPRAGYITIGGANNNARGEDLKARVVVSSHTKNAIETPDSVAILSDAHVWSVIGTAVVAGQLKATNLDNNGNVTGAAPLIELLGDHHRAPLVPAALTAVVLTGGADLEVGSIVAGETSVMPGSSLTPNTRFTGIEVSGSRADSITLNNFLVETAGDGRAIVNGNSQLRVKMLSPVPNNNIAAGSRVITGNGGVGILSNGRVEILNGYVKAGDNGTAIACSSGVLRIGYMDTDNRYNTATSVVGTYPNGNGINILAGENGKALDVSNQAFACTVSVGYLMVKDGGTVLDVRGKDKAVVMGPNTILDASGRTGTGVNATGDILFSGGTVKSWDKGINSTAMVTITDAETRLSGEIVTRGANGVLIRADGSLGVAEGSEELGGYTMTLAPTTNVVVQSSGSFVIRKYGSQRGANDYYEDTLVVKGTITTMERAISSNDPVFMNAGYVKFENGSDMIFNRNYKQSFTNYATLAGGTDEPGKIILSRGVKFNGVTLVNEMFRNWADTLSRVYSTGGTSSDARAVSGSIVIIPPSFAISDSTWGLTAAMAQCEVYQFINLQLPEDTINARNGYNGQMKFSLASGSLPIGLAYPDSDSSLYITESGMISGVVTDRGPTQGLYTFVARLENEAGDTTKQYQVRVHRATAEDNTFFMGKLVNGRDELPFKGNDETTVKYTGQPVVLRIDGDTVKADTNTTGSSTQPVPFRDYYDGFEEPRIWYGPGDGETAAFFSYGTQTPVDAGTYEVFISMNEGRNFNSINHNTMASHVPIGKFTIEQETLDNLIESTVLRVTLPMGVRDEAFTIDLPDVSKFRALYAPITDESTPVEGTFVDTEKELEEVYEDGSAKIANAKQLVFGAFETTEFGDVLTFKLNVIPGTLNNIEGDGVVTVHAVFTDEAGRTESKPVVVVDYLQGKLTGFLNNQTYEVRYNNALVATVTDGQPIDIPSNWIGNSVSIVWKASTQYRIDSEALTLEIDDRPEAPRGVGAVPSTNGQANGKITGVDNTMEWRKKGDESWTPVRGNATEITGLLSGDYEVRVARSEHNFEGVILELLLRNITGIAEEQREINEKTDDAVGTVVDVRALDAQFTMGPNPAARANGGVKLFWQGQALSRGNLSVYDAAGNLVRKVSVTDRGTTEARREVGSWDLKDSKGRAIADGTYLVRGTLKAANGSTVKVSYLVNVR